MRQAESPEERQALLQKVREKWKITVLDLDFFAGSVDW
jgi:hypothetical protein